MFHVEHIPVFPRHPPGLSTRRLPLAIIGHRQRHLIR